MRNTNGTLHYHTLITDPDGTLEQRTSLRSTLQEVIPKLRKNTIGRYSHAKQLIGGQGWVLQEYYSDGRSRLEKYITKNFDDPRMSAAEKRDFLGVLSAEGVL